MPTDPKPDVDRILHEPAGPSFADYLHRNLRRACEAAAQPLQHGQLCALILHADPDDDGNLKLGAQMLVGAPKDLAAELRRFADQLDPADRPRLWFPS